MAQETWNVPNSRIINAEGCRNIISIFLFIEVFIILEEFTS
jgi:hypothetical protein